MWEERDQRLRRWDPLLLGMCALERGLRCGQTACAHQLGVSAGITTALRRSQESTWGYPGRVSGESSYSMCGFLLRTWETDPIFETAVAAETVWAWTEEDRHGVKWGMVIGLLRSTTGCGLRETIGRKQTLPFSEKGEGLLGQNCKCRGRGQRDACWVWWGPRYCQSPRENKLLLF